MFNAQQYKVRIKGKVEKSGGRCSAPLHLGVVANEKGAFGSPSTMVTYFTYLIKGYHILHKNLRTATRHQMKKKKVRRLWIALANIMH